MDYRITTNTRCASCGRLLRKIPGRKKIIQSKVESAQYSQAIEKVVKLGDVFCDKCRLILYTNALTEQNENQSEPASTSSQIPQSQESTEFFGFSQRSTLDSENYSSVYKLQTQTSSLSLCSDSEEYYSQASSTTSYSQSSIDDPSFIPQIRKLDDNELIEMPFQRVVATHKYCFLCGLSNEIVTVPQEARIQVFQKKRIFIPKGNRCCPTHLIKKRFFADELNYLKIYSTTSTVDVLDLTDFINQLSIKCDSELKDRDAAMSDERLKTFTGLTRDNLHYLCKSMTSLRNSKTRTVFQALIVFLFKLRTGNSNNLIASIFGLDRAQQVSDYCKEVICAFEKDILPTKFGYNSISREDLVDHQTSDVAKKLYELDDQLVLIFDGTYIRHEKSTNNAYQRKSYSGQKKVPLCKPFTICTSNGYVVEMEGPFYANQNDAEITKILLNNPDGLQKIMKAGDICVVDRGFRDVVIDLEDRGYKVLMPALRGKRAQLTTEESNESRWVTKIRWVVEAIHGILGQKYLLLHHTLDNKLLPSVRSLFRIACYLNNTFGKRLNSDVSITEKVIQQMKCKRHSENSLAKDAEIHCWNRRKTQFQQLTSADLLDFPELTEEDLKILFTGSYQLSQAVSYLAEMLDDSGNLTLNFLKASENSRNAVIQILARSRHINSKTYKCYIEYTRNSVSAAGILRYVCDCPNGNRTVGCCSHIAAVIYYLSNARYLSNIIRPAEILTKLFNAEEVSPVINIDSDED